MMLDDTPLRRDFEQSLSPWPPSQGLCPIYRCLQETLEAMLAASCAEPLADSRRLEKSFCNIFSFWRNTVCTAFEGSFRHMARTLVPRWVSNILHCLIIEQLYTSSIATELKINSSTDCILVWWQEFAKIFQLPDKNTSRHTGPLKTNSSCYGRVEFWHLEDPTSNFMLEGL